MGRMVLDVKCAHCGTVFKRSVEEKRRKVYAKDEMIRLENKACPQNCDNEWFSVQKQHMIRKFKRHYRDN